MDFKEYKELRLAEIYDYKNTLYENYKEQVKTTNAYIMALSSSGIFAIFILIYKTSLPIEILIYLKVCVALLLFNLITIIVTTTLYSIDSSKNEEDYSKLHDIIKKLNSKDTINDEIKSHFEKIVYSKFYTIMAFFRYSSYLSLIIAVSIIGYLVFIFQGVPIK